MRDTAAVAFFVSICAPFALIFLFGVFNLFLDHMRTLQRPRMDYLLQLFRRAG